MLNFTDEHELGSCFTARLRQRLALVVFKQSPVNKLVCSLASRFVVPYEERIRSARAVHDSGGCFLTAGSGSKVPSAA